MGSDQLVPRRRRKREHEQIDVITRKLSYQESALLNDSRNSKEVEEEINGELTESRKQNT